MWWKRNQVSFETKIIPADGKIDGDPIVVHLMKYYKKYGYNDFILALGAQRNSN